jgi:hypothetical protein
MPPILPALAPKRGDTDIGTLQAMSPILPAHAQKRGDTNIGGLHE